MNDEELMGLNGTSVAGLTVDVIEALVTEAGYELFIRKVSETALPGKEHVLSFSLPPGSRYIVVNFDPHAGLGREELDELRQRLQGLTDKKVVLVEGKDFTPLSRP